MRMFDKDKIMGGVVECTTEEQCEELIDWYLKEINPDEESWESAERDKLHIYGILIKPTRWEYGKVEWYKYNGYIIIPFKEALLVESKQETSMKRYYYVSYLYTTKDGFGSGSCYSQSNSVGLNIPLVQKQLSENEKGTYTILSFTELTKEHYELCYGEIK